MFVQVVQENALMVMSGADVFFQRFVRHSHLVVSPHLLNTNTVVFNIVARANISTSVPQTPSDAILDTLMCRTMSGHTLIVVLSILAVLLLSAHTSFDLFV